VEEDAIHEHVGILKEYSADFLEVLDVYYPLPRVIALKSGGEQELSEQVHVSVKERQIRVHNGGEQPVFVERVTVGDKDKDLRAIITPGDEITLHLDNIHLEVVVHLRVACLLDMIVPRSHALVRHQAERYDPDTIFDVGLSLVRRDGDRREIERLEQVLRYSPHDAVSASKLGELLFHRGDLEKAHARFSQALTHSRHLPDNGARVTQNLRLLERRLRDLKRPEGLGPDDDSAAAEIVVHTK
jgi:hypothetical protein